MVLESQERTVLEQRNRELSGRGISRAEGSAIASQGNPKSPAILFLMARIDPLDPRFTYGDYVQWQGDERWELIDGRSWLMSPAPSRLHQEIVTELSRQARNGLDASPCKVYSAPIDVRFPDDDEANEDIRTVLQPDLVVVCDPGKLDEKGVRGAPDWLLEVLSPATSSRDRIEKRDVYLRHGVREYWIVDPDARTVLVHRWPAGTADVHPLQGALPVEAVVGLSLDFDRIDFD